MPYAGDAALVLVLPDANDGLPAVEKNLSAARLAVWLAQGQSQLVAVTLPKFKETSAFGLNETLQALGIRQAYNPLKADLSGIADVPGKPLYISDAVHKAYISVDEQGTEAAAATAVVLAEATAAPDMPMPQPILFVADHPFLYFIRANSTGAVLFMGRVDDPTQD
jgi:serpin B